MGEIEKKYNIVYIHNQHYYIHDLNTKDFLLENTVPYYFKIGYDEFMETSWLRLIQSIANYLISEYVPSEEELLNFSASWTKKRIFYKENSVSNLQLLENGLYINCNHTALHSCWLIYELLILFNVNLDKVQLIIKRHPIAEYKEVREYYIKLHKEQFHYYLTQSLGKSDEFYNKIVDGLDKTDHLFKKFFPTFMSIYLFDNSAYFSKYKKDYLYNLVHKTDLSEKIINSIDQRLKYYELFMKKYYK